MRLIRYIKTITVVVLHFCAFNLEKIARKNKIKSETAKRLSTKITPLSCAVQEDHSCRGSLPLPLSPPQRPAHDNRGRASSQMKPPAAAMPAPSRQMFQASSGLSGLTLLLTLALIRHFSKPPSAAGSRRGGSRGERARSSSRAKVDAVSHTPQSCRAQRLAIAARACGRRFKKSPTRLQQTVCFQSTTLYVSRRNAAPSV